MNRYETHRAMRRYQLGMWVAMLLCSILILCWARAEFQYESLTQRTEQQARADKMASQVSEGKFIACRKSKLEIHR